MTSSKNESIEEIKNKLLCTRLELISAKMEANAEIKKYEETVKNLYKTLTIVCKERDEARDQLQHLIRNFQPSTPDKTHSTINPKVDHPNEPSCELSLSSLQSNEKKKNSSKSCNLVLSKQTNHQNQNKFGIVKANIDGVDSFSLSLCSIQEESYLSSNTYDKESVNNLDESVPTYLSLAFPGNSIGASQMSHGMNNHTISGKKRKFL
ncbi:unnamed protein product [Trifolium pratense]|uniref:Uncharacterized protein n=1 Tax=Trifolium pratense TaxID=57577 RepID=A0ACB0IL89_TRIPR|nr:unnamed protein product [Trifolium pratense]